MMKKNISTLIAAFLLLFASCSEQAEISDTTGFLSIDSINLSCNNEIIPLTRAIDAGLKLEIWQGVTKVKDFEPGADELNKRIILPVGDYLLKTYTPDLKEAINNEPGHPIYSIEKPFSIESDNLTTLSLTVPQINVGISVLFTEEITTNFTNYHLKITSSTGREVQINENNSGVFYFNIPQNGTIRYTLTAVNADGETMTSQSRTIPQNGSTLMAGNYQIKVKLGS